MTPTLGLNTAVGSAGQATAPNSARRGAATPEKIDALVAEASATPAVADPSRFPPEIPDFPIQALDADTGRGIRAYQVAQARANASAVTLGLSERA